MKYTIAIILIVVTMVATETPQSNNAFTSRQTAPYIARGWRPDGQQLNLPQQSQPQQQVYAAPAQPPPSYGPPQQEYGPPPSGEANERTTNQQTNIYDDEPQAENIKVEPREDKITKSEKLLEEEPKGQFFVVVPQTSNLFYTSALQNAALISVAPKANLVASPARLQALPLSSSIFTPYNSASLIQIYQ